MKKKFLNIPNLMTLIRLAFVPVLIYYYLNYRETMPYVPAIIFIIVALTDIADGYIARRFDMITDIGKVLDPLADKVFIFSMLICLLIGTKSIILVVLLILYIIKETYLIIAGILLYSRKFVVSSKHIGKIATFLLNLGIFIYLLVPYNDVLKTVAEITLLIGMVFSLSAGVYYTISVYRQTGGKLPPKNSKE